MQTIQFTNEKGNVSVQARNQVRTMVEKELLSTLQANEHFTVEINENGGYSIPVAVDSATGTTIYAHLALTISNQAVTKTVRKPKAKEPTAQVVVPNLFA